MVSARRTRPIRSAEAGPTCVCFCATRALVFLDAVLSFSYSCSSYLSPQSIHIRHPHCYLCCAFVGTSQRVLVSVRSPLIQLTILAEMRKQPRPLQYRKLEPRTINAAEAVTLPAQSSDIESAPTTPKSSDPIENWQSLSQHMARSRDPQRPVADSEVEEEEGGSSAGVPDAYRALFKGRRPPSTQRTVAQMKVVSALTSGSRYSSHLLSGYCCGAHADSIRPRITGRGALPSTPPLPTRSLTAT